MIDYRNNNIYTVYIHIIPKSLSMHNNDKYYVGITSRETKKRWLGNGKGYITQKYFYNAIIKYGWENIQHEIIAEHLTKEEAQKMEIVLIKKLQSNQKEYGYNITNGGDGVSGYQFSIDQRLKMSENRMGSKNSFYNKHHSEETKKIMRDHHYDCTGCKNPNAKPIYRFDLDYNFIEKFSSSTEANKKIGYGFSGDAALKGYSYANSYWAREDNITVDENGIIHMKHPPIILNKKNIFQFDKNWNYINKYISGGEAGKITGIAVSCINTGARERRMSKGYYWVYKDDIEIIDSIPQVKEDVKNQILYNEKKKYNNFVSVVNIDNNELFNSLASAASYYNTYYSNIRDAAKQLALGHERRCKGYRWLLYDDYLKNNNLTDKEARNSLFLIDE